MNTLSRLALAATLFATVTATGQAELVHGYLRSNGTYVAPHYRTSANGTPYDNLSYRGYLSQQPGYVSPNSYSEGFRSSPRRRGSDADDSGCTTRLPSFGTWGESALTLPHRNESFRSAILDD